MVSPQKFYVQEISKKTNYRANWLPDKPMNIGDIGKLSDGIFTLYSTLEQQGIPIKVRESTSSLNLDYTSNDSVKITNGLDTAVSSAGLPVAEGKVMYKIDFQRAEGVVFQITDSKKVIIENLSEIENSILEKYKKSVWDLGWVVVTEIVRTDSATIIINTGGSNTLEFEVSGDVGIKSVNLADTSLGLRLIRESGSSTKIIAQANLTPLYVTKGISDPLFGKTKFRGANAYRAIQFDALRELPFNPSEIE
jgi:hypothetical protein